MKIAASKRSALTSRALRSLLAVVAAFAIPTLPARADYENRALMVPGFHEALALATDLIQSARPGETIRQNIYFTNPDRVGLARLASLCLAAKSGIPVELIFDQEANRLSKGILAYLNRVGIKVYAFHPFDLADVGESLARATKRSHEKFLKVGNRLIVTDRNTADKYYGFTDHPALGLDVYMEGPIAEEADRYFDELLSSGHVKRVDPKNVPESEIQEAEKLIAEAPGKLLKEIGIEKLPSKPWSLLAQPVRQARLITDPVGQKTLRGPLVGTGETLIGLLSEAQRSIRISSNYLIPTADLREAWKSFRQKPAANKLFEIYTNSGDSSDNRTVIAAFRASLNMIAASGPDVHVMNEVLPGYEVPFYNHRKIWRIDDDITYTGSAHLDNRALRLNQEVGVLIHDRAWARRADGLLDEIKGMSKPAVIKGKIVWAEAGHPFKRCGLLLMAPIRHQL